MSGELKAKLGADSKDQANAKAEAEVRISIP